MSSGMFRGKDFSNRIELSRLVQDLLKLSVIQVLPVALWGVGGRWVGGCIWVCMSGCQPPDMYTRAHACTRAHTNVC